MRVYALIAIVFCLFPSLKANGQNRKFESRELRQAASLLSKEVPYAEMLYQFTENYLNQLLAASDKEREWKMRTDDFRIEDGGLDRLHLVCEETSLAMRARNNRYSVSLSNGNSRLIEFSCPMSYQLITQKKLKELESEFMKELSEYRTGKDTSDDKAGEEASVEVKKNELIKTAPHLYVRKGADYFWDAINGNLYYIEEKGKLRLIYDSGYIGESFCNMLLSEDTPCDILLKLFVRQYGFKTDELQIPLKQWISYCRSKGCDLYVGIEAMETDKLKACVFAVNEPFKYNHVMNLEIPYTLLDEKEGEVEANITIFIPTYNLSALFEELNLTNKKKK